MPVPDIYSTPSPQQPSQPQQPTGPVDIYTNPMDVPAPAQGPGPVGGVDASKIGHAAGSALSTIAGHQDIMFIIYNAMKRDAAAGRGEKNIVQLLRDPKSITAQAFTLWRKNPSEAMDEYGLNSTSQMAFDAAHGDFVAKALEHNPALQTFATMVEESVANPVAMAEGGALGKVANMAKGLRPVQRLGQHIANATGFGSPMYDLANRGGTEAVSWANSLIHSAQAPHQFLKMAPASQFYQQIFGGLDHDAQWEVQRLSEGLKPDPKYFKQYKDLKARADLLRQRERQVTAHQVRTGILKKNQVHGNFSPMRGAYDLTVKPTIEEHVRSQGRGLLGGGFTGAKPKTFQNTDQALASGLQLKDVPRAEAWTNWDNARMSAVAIEDALKRAPQSLRIPPSKGLRATLIKNQGKVGGQEYRYAADPQHMFSPQMRKGAWAPEVLDFLGKHNTLQKLVTQPGVIPGTGGSDFAHKFLAFSRNMIISNFMYHPVFNVAGNEAVARGRAGLGGLRPEVGGQVLNSIRAAALQMPEWTKLPQAMQKMFIGNAQEYASWLDRALKAGATGEFGTPMKSALGGSRQAVMTVPQKTWLGRLDKAFTKLGDFNRERTFGSRGEQHFAVSLFKDAVESGKYTDAGAAQLVRNAFHDYYNIDPNTPWSYVDFFMPWRKGNWKFWLGTLTDHPQYVTGVSHGLRTASQQMDPQDMQGPFGHPDFQVQTPSGPFTPSFPGRDVENIANVAGSVAKGDPLGAIEAGGKTLFGSENPITRAYDMYRSTEDTAFSPDVKGPELPSGWDLLFNPKAPKDVQRRQLFQQAMTLIPKPLVGFAINDAIRRGWKPEYFRNTVMSAVGLGYPGSQHLQSGQKRLLSRAERTYKKAYYAYLNDPNSDEVPLEKAWSHYMDEVEKATESKP